MIAFRTFSAVTALCGLLAACDSPYEKVDPETGIPILPVPPQATPPGKLTTPGQPGIGKASAALTAASSCDDVADAFKAQAMAEVVERTQQAFESAWNQHDHCDDEPYYPGPGYYADAGVAMPSADAGGTSGPTDPDDPEHSETNNQVVGVDEADIVKTDGKHLYMVSQGELRIVKSWPAASTAILSSLAVDGTPKKLFVLGDRLLLYTSLPRTNSYPNDPYGPYGGGSSGYGSGECTYGYDCVPTGDGHPTRITVFDISDRAAPKAVRELDLSSSLLSARRIGSAVHTVVTEPVGGSLTQGVDYYVNDLDICDSTKLQIYQAYKALLAESLKQIAAKTAPELFPSGTDKQAGDANPFASCAGFYKASVNDGQQFTSIVSLDINDNAPAQAVTILSRPGVVYASADSLYLAVPRVRTQWGWYEGLDDTKEATSIHKFVLANGTAETKGVTASAYTASGVIKGRILNQFALDEHAEHLRVASTTGHVGGGSNAHNTLTVLAQQGQALKQVGLLDKLAPTEDIRSVRFDGDKGYVVTFKKTDPLFVLDLAEPTAPKVLGELKIPGFSTYMHKMDDTHLLTIGYDADDQGSFAWFTGVMLQIFDVTDPTDPKLKFKHVIGTRGSSSEALTNHLAFTYYAPKNLLALPMTVCEDPSGSSGGSYGMNMTFSGLMVFDVTAAAGFALRGQVEHPMPEYASCGNWWTQASSQVKRSIIIDNYVYSLSDDLLKVNSLDDLSTDLVTVPLSLPSSGQPPKL